MKMPQTSDEADEKRQTTGRIRKDGRDMDLGKTRLIATILYCASVIILFFMPWFRMGDIAVSGDNLARIGVWGNIAWSIPFLAWATIFATVNGVFSRGLIALTVITQLSMVLYGVIKLAEEWLGFTTVPFVEYEYTLSLWGWCIIVISLGMIGVLDRLAHNKKCFSVYRVFVVLASAFYLVLIIWLST